MPFTPRSFDAAYAIEATAHAPSLPQVYANIHEILKPGGVFLTSEWVMTPKFDPSNDRHVSIRNHIERGNAVPSMPTSDHARTSLTSAGFAITYEEDYAHHWSKFLRYSADPSSAEDSSSSSSSSSTNAPELQPGYSPVLVPFKSGTACAPVSTRPIHHLPSKKSASSREWYYPLFGQTSLTVNSSDWWLTWKMSTVPRKTSYWILRILESLRLYPKGVTEAMDILREAVDGLADGGKEDIFSPCWWFVCRKEHGEVVGFVGELGQQKAIEGHET